MPGARNARPDY